MKGKNLLKLVVFYIISLIIFLQCSSVQEEIKIESDDHIDYIDSLMNGLDSLQVYGTDTLKFKDFYVQPKDY